MTTQELKQQIDKVLGNSIRCLLPSYWWKRVFNQVADRIDEVEQSTSQLIDSKVEESKMPIVESVDELSKLDLPKGSVTSVEKVGEPVVVNLEDCYLSGDAATDWDKYTVIRGFSEKGTPSNSVGQIHLYSDKSMENGLTIACGEGEYFYYKIVNGRRYYSSLEEVNEYLASGEYRLVFGYYIENISAYVTLYSAFPQPSLYIKGDSWERLAKESDLEGIEGESGDALVFGAERYAYVSIEKDVAGNITESELTDEQIAYNQETVSLLASGENVYLSYDGTFWMKYGHEISSSKATYFFSVVSLSMMSTDKLWGRMMAVSSDGSIAIVNTTIGGSSITIDSELSETSENPVQNKVITAELDYFAEQVADAINSKADASAVETINTRLSEVLPTVADKTYVDSAISAAITNTLNTEV